MPKVKCLKSHSSSVHEHETSSSCPHEKEVLAKIHELCHYCLWYRYPNTWSYYYYVAIKEKGDTYTLYTDTHTFLQIPEDTSDILELTQTCSLCSTVIQISKWNFAMKGSFWHQGSIQTKCPINEHVFPTVAVFTFLAWCVTQKSLVCKWQKVHSNPLKPKEGPISWQKWRVSRAPGWSMAECKHSGEEPAHLIIAVLPLCSGLGHWILNGCSRYESTSAFLSPTKVPGKPWVGLAWTTYPCLLEQIIPFRGTRHLIGQQRRKRRRKGGKEKKKIGQGHTGDKQKCNVRVASLSPEGSCWFSSSILSQKFHFQDRTWITDPSMFL